MWVDSRRFAGIPSAVQHRPSQIRVDLGRLGDNLSVVRRAAAGRPVCAVVKANAYGHGMLPVARALAGAGIDAFGVALVEEGVALREAGLRQPVWVWAADFGGPAGWGELVARRLTPVLQDPGQLAALAAAVRAAGRPHHAAHVEVDIGMARGGLARDALADFVAAAARHPEVRLEAVMGHFSAADSPHLAARTDAERARHRAAIGALAPVLAPGAGAHLANSAGLLCAAQAGDGAARTGIALYGLQPSLQQPVHGLRPVLSWTTRLVAVRAVAAGEAVSYGGLWRAPRAGRIGTLPVGYADGYTRRLSGRAHVLVGGRRVPVVGAICMDFCMVDLGNAEHAAVGDPVVLVGEDGGERITIDELAAWSGTIHYEICCALGARLARLYIGGS